MVVSTVRKVFLAIIAVVGSAVVLSAVFFAGIKYQASHHHPVKPVAVKPQPEVQPKPQPVPPLASSDHIKGKWMFAEEHSYVLTIKKNGTFDFHGNGSHGACKCKGTIRKVVPFNGAPIYVLNSNADCQGFHGQAKVEVNHRQLTVHDSENGDMMFVKKRHKVSPQY